ncbi:MAG: hypothetical protein NZ570_06380 [Candidatus Caldarchaeum sp.]|nr:hypothetical protein [Candidatus Caldarchaeum sp.]MDW8359781.1 hypothetical protein [Candidatus Caldarchaeum sp.]
MSLYEALAVFVVAAAGVSSFGYLLVRGAEALSDKLGLGRFLIGFVLLSVLTSMPEMTVAVFSAVQGVVELSVGDILGSNIVNICLVVGLSSLFITRIISVGMNLLKDLAAVLYFSSLIPILLVFVPQVFIETGVLLILVFVSYAYITYRTSKTLNTKPHIPGYGYPAILSAVVIGGLGVIVSAMVLVSAARSVVEYTGLSELEVGAKMVAVSTSAPELVTVLASMRRREYEMALGNAIGSNLTNITLILGSLLLVSRTTLVFQQHTFTVLFLLLATSTFWFFVSRGTITRVSGVILLVLYLFFLLLAA